MNFKNLLITLTTELKDEGLMLEAKHQTADRLINSYAEMMEKEVQKEIQKAVKMNYENDIKELNNKPNMFKKMEMNGAIEIFLKHRLSKY